MADEQPLEAFLTPEERAEIGRLNQEIDVLEMKDAGDARIKELDTQIEELQAAEEAATQPPSIKETVTQGVAKTRGALAKVLGVEEPEQPEQPETETSFRDQAVAYGKKLFPDNARMASIVTFGMLGSAYGGMATAGNPIGVIGGGALGAAFGSALSDIDKLVEEQIRNAAKEARDDVAFGMGIPIVGRALKSLGPTVGRMLGVSGDASKRLAQSAERVGIPVGAVEVSEKQGPALVRDVVGVFPFVSGPFRKAAQSAKSGVVKALADRLDWIAPHGSMSVLGVDMVEAARNSSKAFRMTAKALYGSADNLVKGAADDLALQGDELFLPVKGGFIREAAEDALAVRQSVLTREGGKVVPVIPTEVQTYLRGLSDVVDNFSIDELRSIQKNLNDMGKQYGDNNTVMAMLSKVKEATDFAMANLDLNKLLPETAQGIKDAYDTANGFFAAGMKTFETKTSKQFQRVDKNIFRSKWFQAGGLNADEIARQLIKTKSPEDIVQLRKLVGSDKVKQAFRAHLDEVVEKATIIDETSKVSKINFDLLERELGLAGVRARPSLAADKARAALGYPTPPPIREAVRTAKGEVLEELLKDTNVTIKEFEDILAVGKQLGPIPLTRKFIARRAVLGGIKAAGKTALFGAAGTFMGLMQAGMSIALVRQGGKFLTSPGALAAMQGATDINLSRQIRKNHAVRFFRLAFEDEDPEEIKEMVQEFRIEDVETSRDLVGRAARETVDVLGDVFSSEESQ